MIFFSACHGSVALVLTQVGAAGNSDSAQGGIIACRFERLLHFL